MENDDLRLDEIFNDPHPLCFFENHCEECRLYWNTMVFTGRFDPYRGWTEKAIMEFLNEDI